MYRVGVKKRFSAAHRLEGHEGKCSRLHGHTWCVEAVFSSVEVGREGMAIDFDVAGSILEKVIAPYDHRFLKEIEGGGHPIRLAEVKVWESPDSWASYGGG
jgi:6-pyruvoyltetrahydropterin/6-carboxytetrahydropterin synthase